MFYQVPYKAEVAEPEAADVVALVIVILAFLKALWGAIVRPDET